MRSVFLVFTCLLLLLPAVNAQEKVEIYKKILRSKDQMVASATIGISPANFIDKDLRLDYWKNFQYNSQFLQFSFGMTDMKRLNEHNELDTVLLREWTVGANIPIGALAIGRRLYDIRGILMMPSVGVSVGKRRMEDYGAWIGKVSPTVSLQFPYVGIDFKLHSSFNIYKSIPGAKKLAFTPEIGIKFDGLYNLLDASRVFIGHSEGTYQSTTVEHSSTTERDGDYIITTNYRTETTKTIPYSIDRNATVIGPLAAIGPHISFQSHPYAGVTRMAGLGYYIRLGIFSTDLLFDTGKIGFASSMKVTETITDPSPKSLQKVNKKDFSNVGQYNATRFQARCGVDIYEIIRMGFGRSNAVGRMQAKFSRLILGMGYGYALVSAPHYLMADGMTVANERFESDYTLLTTPSNHAKFGKDGGYVSLYCSVEAGAIRLTFEGNRYFSASLANVNSISIGYMFPYRRIAKKMKAIKSYKKYIHENS